MNIEINVQELITLCTARGRAVHEHRMYLRQEFLLMGARRKGELRSFLGIKWRRMRDKYVNLNDHYMAGGVLRELFDKERAIETIKYVAIGAQGSTYVDKISLSSEEIALLHPMNHYYKLLTTGDETEGGDEIFFEPTKTWEPILNAGGKVLQDSPTIRRKIEIESGVNQEIRYMISHIDESFFVTDRGSREHLCSCSDIMNAGLIRDSLNRTQPPL